MRLEVWKERCHLGGLYAVYAGHAQTLRVHGLNAVGVMK